MSTPTENKDQKDKDKDGLAGLSGLAPVTMERTKTLNDPDALKSVQGLLKPNSEPGTGSGSEKREIKLPAGDQFGGARKGAKQWQEDSFLHFVSATGRVYIGCVMDGHGGYNGLVASNTARDVALAMFEKAREEMEKWSIDDWQKQLLLLFNEMHNTIRSTFVTEKTTETGAPRNGKPTRFVDDKGIVRSPNGDPIHGGTTCSIVVMVRTPESADSPATLITANVGDSTALLMPAQFRGKYEFLTVDHGPESPEEYMRVRSLNKTDYPEKLLFVYDKTNVFRKYECPSVFLEDGSKDQTFVANPWGNGLHPTNVRYEPAVYAVTPRTVTKDSTCIAMTRALGDFYAHQFGLTNIPSIGIKKLSPGMDYSIVVASDGIWDCWKYEDFMQFCNDQFAKNKDKTVADVGTTVLNESIQRAITNFGSKHYDDASLVLWQLKTSGNSSSNGSSSSTDNKKA